VGDVWREGKRSLLVAFLSPVIGSLYQYFSVTHMPSV